MSTPDDPTVLVGPEIFAGGGPPLVEEIRERLSDIELRHVEDRDDAVEIAPDVDVMVTHRVPDAFLAAAESLQWIQALSAGTDRFDHDRLADRDIILTSVSGVHAKPIGQQVLGYLLFFERRFHRAIAQQRANEWQRFGAGELGDRTVCVVGLGAIGSQVAEYCDAFGARVVGTKRDPSSAPAVVADVRGPDGLSALLPEADYLVIACPLTDATRGMIDGDVLDRLDDRAVVINIARGPIIDERALIDRLADDELRGAGLDVFEEEPLPEDSPLWEFENVIVTPHMAGSTPHYWARSAEIFARNYERFVAGDRMGLDNRVV